jgi:tetratricopeptide (TPR) repeat protein
MNKLLTLFLVLVTTLSFAQKAKVYTASTALSSGNLLEAKKEIDEAFKSGDADVLAMTKAWLTKGEVYNQLFQTGLFKELNVVNPIETAEEAFRKAYEVDLANEKKPGKDKSVVMDGLLNAAISYSDKGRASYGEQLFEIAMNSFVKSAETIKFIAEKDGLKAENKADVLVLQNEAYQNAALCALSLSNFTKAIEIYNLLLDMGDGSEEVYANLSVLYLSSDQFEPARKVIDKGLELFPKNVSLIESDLNYYIGTNQSEKAVGKLDAAIQASPNNPDLYFNLAIAQDKLGNDEAMIAAYTKIIELDPKYYGAYLNLGAFYNDKANEVIKVMNEMSDYKAANKMLPQRDEWYNKAIPYLEKAFELQPEDPAVRKALSRIYANMDMLDKVKALSE